MRRAAAPGALVVVLAACAGGSGAAAPALTFANPAPARDVVECLVEALERMDYQVQRTDKRDGLVEAIFIRRDYQSSDPREFRRSDRLLFERAKGGVWGVTIDASREFGTNVGLQREPVAPSEKASADATTVAGKCTAAT